MRLPGQEASRYLVRLYDKYLSSLLCPYIFVFYLGYSLLAGSVPATGLTMLVEIPSLREALIGENPYEKSWINTLIDFIRKNWLENGLFEGETEMSLVEDRELYHLMQYNVPVQIVGLGSNVEYEDLSLPANTHATAQGIWYNLYPDDKKSNMNGKIALEFLDVQCDKDNQRDSSLVEEATYFPTPQINDEDRKLLFLTQGYSSWQYFSHMGLNADKVSAEAERESLNSNDLKISELEWQKARLEMEMINPNCVREIDVMQEELKEIQIELGRLKGGWTKWFG